MARRQNSCRQTDRQADREASRQPARQAGKQAGRHEGRQANRQAGRQASRQTSSDRGLLLFCSASRDFGGPQQLKYLKLRLSRHALCNLCEKLLVAYATQAHTQGASGAYVPHEGEELESEGPHEGESMGGVCGTA